MANRTCEEYVISKLEDANDTILELYDKVAAESATTEYLMSLVLKLFDVNYNESGINFSPKDPGVLIYKDDEEYDVLRSLFDSDEIDIKKEKLN